MVRTVRRAQLGDWADAKLLLIIALMISLVLIGAGWLGLHPLLQLDPGWRVLAGGLIFGVAAAWNQGCFVGTSIQLMAGDLRAALSVLGWVVGFRLLGLPAPLQALPSSGGRGVLSAALLLVLLLTLGLRPRFQNPNPAAIQAPLNWRAALVCGVMLGVLDNDLWRWDPSSLARALAHPATLAMTGHGLFGLMLLVGMAADAQLQHRFSLTLPRCRDLPRVAYGGAMAIGAALAMGGNDSQLLRYLPSGSPHSWLAVPVMVVGILVGLKLAGRLRQTSA